MKSGPSAVLRASSSSSWSPLVAGGWLCERPDLGTDREGRGGQQPVCQNCVNVEVALPAPGAEPSEIVEGYLRATSNYQPNYSVAKQFLTRMAAEKWSPEDGASIYRGSLTATGDQAAKGESPRDQARRATRRLAGEDRTYTAEDQSLSQNFDLVLERERRVADQ